MAVAPAISVEEYLKTTYRPDCDYIDGEILERNLGEFEHGSTQAEIVAYLRLHYPRLRWRVLTETRVQTSPTRFRVPDVCVLEEGAPREQIIRTPPALCIEILSPEDRTGKTMRRLDDYFQMGVPVCWVIDPLDRRGWIVSPGQLTAVTEGVLRAGDLEVPLTEVLPPAGQQ
ncbi:MAG TPA: Uma2 family endonuclease [Bryobacteraceae bacterium]|nr:Uma2 family endonuclease [Bryobacteraceae bacterium]